MAKNPFISLQRLWKNLPVSGVLFSFKWAVKIRLILQALFHIWVAVVFFLKKQVPFFLCCFFFFLTQLNCLLIGIGNLTFPISIMKLLKPIPG